MLAFKKITISALQDIIPYIQAQPYNTCDYSILGVYMWVDYFQYEYAIYENCLYMREKSNKLAVNYEYLLPIAMDGDFELCVNRIIDYEESLQHNCVIFTVVPEEWLIKLNNFKFGYTVDSTRLLRDWCDYTYFARDLAELTGKKFSKKRNLVNQFYTNYPNYCFKPLSQDNIQDVLSFFHLVRTIEFDSDLAIYENNQVQSVLENLSAYSSIIGGVLSINKSVIGFCIGEIINNCLYIHIEKANREYKGVYQVLNQLFANYQYEHKKIQLINREEDVGDEGLRRSKMSYFPILISKYEVGLVK